MAWLDEQTFGVSNSVWAALGATALVGGVAAVAKRGRGQGSAVRVVGSAADVRKLYDSLDESQQLELFDAIDLGDPATFKRFQRAG